MKKYSALRTIATILKILGIISLVLTILGALAACLISFSVGSVFNEITRDLYGYSSYDSASIIGGIIGGVVIILIGGLYSLIIYGGGELIYVLIDVEQNTRETANVLRIASGAPPQP